MSSIFRGSSRPVPALDAQAQTHLRKAHEAAEVATDLHGKRADADFVTLSSDAARSYRQAAETSATWQMAVKVGADAAKSQKNAETNMRGVGMAGPTGVHPEQGKAYAEAAVVAFRRALMLSPDAKAAESVARQIQQARDSAAFWGHQDSAQRYEPLIEEARKRVAELSTPHSDAMAKLYLESAKNNAEVATDLHGRHSDKAFFLLSSAASSSYRQAAETSATWQMAVKVGADAAKSQKNAETNMRGVGMAGPTGVHPEQGKAYAEAAVVAFRRALMLSPDAKAAESVARQIQQARDSAAFWGHQDSAQRYEPLIEEARKRVAGLSAGS